MYKDIFQLYKLLTENDVFIANYTFPNEKNIVERLSQKYNKSETFIFSDLVKIEDMKYKANEITISLMLKYNVVIILDDGDIIVEPVNDLFTIIEDGKYILSHINLISKENVRKLINDTFFKSKQNQNLTDVEYFIEIKDICLNCLKLSHMNLSETYAIWKKLIDEKIKLVKQLNINTSIDIYNPYENSTKNIAFTQSSQNIFINSIQIMNDINKIDYWLARINYTAFLGDRQQFIKHSLTN